MLKGDQIQLENLKEGKYGLFHNGSILEVITYVDGKDLIPRFTTKTGMLSVSQFREKCKREDMEIVPTKDITYVF